MTRSNDKQNNNNNVNLTANNRPNTVKTDILKNKQHTST